MYKELVEEIRTSIPDFYIETAWVYDPSLIVEGTNLLLKGTKYYYRIDPPRGLPGPGNQYHFHLIFKGHDVLAINIDGTSHDGWHQVRIPDEVIPFLIKRGFTIPENQIIESSQCRPEIELIVESIRSNRRTTNDYSTHFNQILNRSNEVEVIHDFVEGAIYLLPREANLGFKEDVCYCIKQCKRDEGGYCVKVILRFAISDDDNYFEGNWLSLLRCVSRPLHLDSFTLLSIGFDRDIVVVEGQGESIVLAKTIITETAYHRIYLLPTGEGYKLLHPSSNGAFTVCMGTIDSVDSLLDKVRNIYHIDLKLMVGEVNHIMLMHKRIEKYLSACNSLLGHSSATTNQLLLNLQQMFPDDRLDRADFDRILKYAEYKQMLKLVFCSTGVYVEKI